MIYPVVFLPAVSIILPFLNPVLSVIFLLVLSLIHKVFLHLVQSSNLKPAIPLPLDLPFSSITRTSSGIHPSHLQLHLPLPKQAHSTTRGASNGSTKVQAQGINLEVPVLFESVPLGMVLVMVVMLTAECVQLIVIIMIVVVASAAVVAVVAVIAAVPAETKAKTDAERGRGQVHACCGLTVVAMMSMAMTKRVVESSGL
jgi:hypothetical protein